MATANSTAARDLIEEHGLPRNRFLAAYAEVHLVGAEIVTMRPAASVAPQPSAPSAASGPGGKHKADRRRPDSATVRSHPAARTPAPRPVHAPSWTGNVLAGSALSAG